MKMSGAVALNGHFEDHIYCFPVAIMAGDHINYTITESFDFGTALENVYPLLGSIFKYLNYSDLVSATAVSETWSKYANEELKKRNKPSWLSVTSSKGSGVCLEKSENYTYDQVSFALVFYVNKRLNLNRHISLRDSEKTSRMTFIEYLTNEVVPKNTDFWTVSCRRIYNINKTPDRKTVNSIPLFNCLLLPAIPNVNIHAFYTTIMINSIDEMRNIPLHETIHCLLLFTLSSSDKLVENVTHSILKRQNSKSFALGGGIITGGIKPFEKVKKQQVSRIKHFYCIAFTQKDDVSADFNAYSIVIKEEDHFEARLVEFKEKTMLRQNSFAFRICCAAKHSTETETPLFYKYFPNTFVVGLDADGEFGWNKFHTEDCNSDEECAEKKSRLFPKMLHEYSTVIVIITWGSKIK